MAGMTNAATRDACCLKVNKLNPGREILPPSMQSCILFVLCRKMNGVYCQLRSHPRDNLHEPGLSSCCRVASSPLGHPPSYYHCCWLVIITSFCQDPAPGHGASCCQLGDGSAVCWHVGRFLPKFHQMYRPYCALHSMS